MQVETRRGLIDRNNRLATKDHKWVANDDDRWLTTVAMSPSQENKDQESFTPTKHNVILKQDLSFDN